MDHSLFVEEPKQDGEDIDDRLDDGGEDLIKQEQETAGKTEDTPEPKVNGKDLKEPKVDKGHSWDQVAESRGKWLFKHVRMIRWQYCKECFVLI